MGVPVGKERTTRGREGWIWEVGRELKLKAPMKAEVEIVLFVLFCLNVVDKEEKSFWQLSREEELGKSLHMQAQDQNFLREKNLKQILRGQTSHSRIKGKLVTYA